MQLEAPPGQPVCKHSLIECVLWKGARASVPQQTPAGPSQPHSAPPFPPGLGRAGEGGLQTPLSSILGHTVFAMHGFSWLLRSPLGGSLGRESPRWLPGLAPLPLRCPSSWALEWGSPYLRVNLGLSTWSLWFLQSALALVRLG